MCRRPATVGPETVRKPRATLRAWLENTVTAAAVADGARVPPHRVSKETMKVVVFHRRRFRLPLMLHLSCLLTVPD
jgi:hypothetical protein